jgi:hypothetical protein
MPAASDPTRAAAPFPPILTQPRRRARPGVLACGPEASARAPRRWPEPLRDCNFSGALFRRTLPARFRRAPGSRGVTLEAAARNPRAFRHLSATAWHFGWPGCQSIIFFGHDCLSYDILSGVGLRDGRRDARRVSRLCLPAGGSGSPGRSGRALGIVATVLRLFPVGIASLNNA